MAFPSIELPSSMPEAFHGFLPPYPLREMTEEENQLFLEMCLRDRDTSKHQDIEQHFGNSFPYGVISRRFKAHGVPVAPPVIVALAYFCVPPTRGTPAHLVVSAWTLAQHYKSLKRQTMMRMTDFGTGPFANGWPDFSDEKAWVDCWDAQKFEGLNLLDVLPWI